MSAGWKAFPDGEDHPGRELWLLAEGGEPRLARYHHDDLQWVWDGDVPVAAVSDPYPHLCHEVVPPALPGPPADGHPEAAPGPLEVHPDESGLGGWCLTLGPRGGPVASGIAKPDAVLLAELWNGRLGKPSTP